MDKKKEEKLKAKHSPKEKISSIYTDAEIKKIVKEFIQNYIGGGIKLNFPLAQEIIEQKKFEDKKISKKVATDQEVEIKNKVNNLISVCCGTIETTKEQHEEAVKEMFKTILVFRGGDRIKGRFTDNSFDEKIMQLEEKQGITNELVKALYDEVVDFKGLLGDGKNDILP